VCNWSNGRFFAICNMPRQWVGPVGMRGYRHLDPPWAAPRRRPERGLQSNQYAADRAALDAIGPRSVRPVLTIYIRKQWDECAAELRRARALQVPAILPAMTRIIPEFRTGIAASTPRRAAHRPTGRALTRRQCQSDARRPKREDNPVISPKLWYWY
jgi:hypothetical protein